MRKHKNLAELGVQAAKLDKRLVKILAERMRLAVAVARCKMRDGNRPILRREIEEQRRVQWVSWACEYGLDPEFARTVFNIVLAESCRVQIHVKESCGLDSCSRQ